MSCFREKNSHLFLVWSKMSSCQKVQSVIDISEFAITPMRLFADELTCAFSQEPLDGGF